MAKKVYFLEGGRIKVEEIKGIFYIMYSNMYDNSMTVCTAKIKVL